MLCRHSGFNAQRTRTLAQPQPSAISVGFSLTCDLVAFPIGSKGVQSSVTAQIRLDFRLAPEEHRVNASFAFCVHSVANRALLLLRCVPPWKLRLDGHGVLCERECPVRTHSIHSSEFLDGCQIETHSPASLPNDEIRGPLLSARDLCGDGN